MSVYVFGRGPNCYLEITVYTMLFDKVACFYSQKCVSSVWESTSDGFFFFFYTVFQIADCVFRTEQAGFRAQKEAVQLPKSLSLLSEM